jgi:hypothetical protein
MQGVGDAAKRTDIIGMGGFVADQAVAGGSAQQS